MFMMVQNSCRERERKKKRAFRVRAFDLVETKRKKKRSAKGEWREGVSELQTEWRCLSLGACLGAQPN